MRNPSVNEIMSIINEGFNLDTMKCIGLHDSDILWTNENPYTVTLNVYSRKITIFEDGYQVSHLTNRSLISEEVDMVEYNKLRSNLFSNINQESIQDIKRGLKKLELFEKYEKAELVKLFLEELNG